LRLEKPKKKDNTFKPQGYKHRFTAQKRQGAAKPKKITGAAYPKGCYFLRDCCFCATAAPPFKPAFAARGWAYRRNDVIKPPILGGGGGLSGGSRLKAASPDPKGLHAAVF